MVLKNGRSVSADTLFPLKKFLIKMEKKTKPALDERVGWSSSCEFFVFEMMLNMRLMLEDGSYFVYVSRPNESCAATARYACRGLHIPADHEHQFWFNVNTISGPT